MKTSHQARRAFTLVEILVVLAIISILTAVLVPVFSRVRESGKTRACASNLRQLGLAFTQYLADDGGRYPGAGQYQSWGNGGHWVSGVDNSPLADSISFQYEPSSHADVQDGAIYPYVKASGVYECPSTQDAYKKELSYSMNCAIAGMGQIRVHKPTEIVLLVDESYSLNDGFFWAYDNGLRPPYAAGTSNSTDTLNKVHNGGGNILFCDGHVKYYPFDAFTLDDTDQGLANKVSLTNVPRFYDKGFGAGGFFSSPTFFSCGNPVSP